MKTQTEFYFSGNATVLVTHTAPLNYHPISFFPHVSPTHELQFFISCINKNPIEGGSGYLMKNFFVQISRQLLLLSFYQK